MNRKLFFVFGILFLVITLSGTAGWFFYKPPKSNHQTAVADSSLSLGGNRCHEVAKLSEIALKRQPADDHTQLAVFLTGDEKTAYEPRLLGNFTIPQQVRLTEGSSALTEKQNDILTEIEAGCEQISPSRISSIFLALKRAVEHLRTLGCDDETSKCEILAKTDLQENADSLIKTAILGTSFDSAKPLPPPIDNRGIRIKICGISQTKGEFVSEKGRKRQLTQNRDTVRADLIQAVWKKLFTHPDLVSFAPYCSE